MFRSIFGFAIVAVLAWLGLKIVFGILGGLIGLAMTILWLAALGATSHRDFRRLAGVLPALHDGGVVLNLGSAVVMPEVFLKALTVARNLSGGKPAGFTACDCDMQRHYRPRVNVVERPTQGGGRGIQLTGHHEILIPLLCWAVLQRLDGR